MTAIEPLAANPALTIDSTSQGAQTTPSSNQLGEDTFLKLLVAQMQYQDPMNPTDSTQFLTQTAQFTEVEALNNIESDLKQETAANEVLEAGSMIGKNVSVATQNGTPAVTSVVHLGGNLSVDDPVGTVTSTNTTLYTNKGTAEPVKVELTKLANNSDGSSRWAARAYVSTTPIAGPYEVDFDKNGELTSGDLTISSSQLDNIPGTNGEWDPNGVRIDLGSATDTDRLRVATGADALTTFGQNGTDGTSVSGVVTGVEFTANGPLLTINNKQFQMTDVTNVNVV
jgi:flagellar basal-body rod modification protein FlgD